MTWRPKKIKRAHAVYERPSLAVIQRLLTKIRTEDLGHDTPCWIWTGYCDPYGYPQVRALGKVMWAHRVAYLIFNGGSLEAGLEIDHLCHNPSCINPDHLSAATVSENRSRTRKSAKEEVSF